MDHHTPKTIQFVHANAYTPGCYKKFLAFIDEEHVITPLLRPLWPGSNPSDMKSWDLFAEDLIKFMDDKGLSQVVGIGHSLGGVTSWLASLKRPDLFSQLILIDPVMLESTKTRGVSLMPYEIKKRMIPIVKIAANRRNHWDDEQAIRDHLGVKKVFKRFDPDVFDDFIEYGFRKTDKGSILAYPREWEARVYAYPPDLWPLMPTNKVPMTIIRAQYSDVINDNSWQRIQNDMANAKFIQMDKVGHLIPFEQPEAIAAIVKEILINT